jgi:FAD/FMN-containing dehydrogenase
MHIIAHVPEMAEQPYERINQIIYDLVKKHLGTVSAEHGIGLTKKPYLSLTRSAEELALMRLIKHAIDPSGVLNPGKVFDFE